MTEQTIMHAAEITEPITDGTPVLLWDIAVAWEISYNTLYLAGRRGRIPVWRDGRGRIYTTREAAEQWYAGRAGRVAPDDADPPLPIREAASTVGVSRSTVSRGVSRGLIPSQQSAAGTRLVRAGDIRTYLKSAAPPRSSLHSDVHPLPPDGVDHDGARDGITPNPLERRRVLVHVLRDIGWRITEQSDLLSYDLTQGDYTAIQNRAQHIRQLSDTVEELRTILNEET